MKEEDLGEPFIYINEEDICPRCGYCYCKCCTCPGGPRGPKLSTGKYDEPHGNDFKSDRDDKQHGLQYWVSIFGNWIRHHSKW